MMKDGCVFVCRPLGRGYRSRAGRPVHLVYKARMAKVDTVEAQLARLAELKNASDPNASLHEIRKALSSKTNLLVAKAADLANAMRVSDLDEPMHAAFDRFMHKPTSTDKGCLAKTALARALYELGINDAELFLRGIHHVQLEPVWGGSADSAAELRGICALGLVRCNYREVMSELAELLIDPDASARLSAARAIGYSENDLAGAPLLRLKLLAGDAHPDVQAECFSALIKLAPVKSIAFVARFLERDDADARQMAMLALGESQQPAAFELLLQCYERDITMDRRRPLLLAIAMTRLPASQTLLLEVVEEAHRDLAASAIEAMKLYRSDEAMAKRVRNAVEARDEASLREVFDRVFT